MDAWQRGPGLDEPRRQLERLGRGRRVGEPLAVADDAGQQCRCKLGVELDPKLRHQSREDLARRGRVRIDEVEVPEVVAADVVIDVEQPGLRQPLALLDGNAADARERGGVAHDGNVGLQHRPTTDLLDARQKVEHRRGAVDAHDLGFGTQHAVRSGEPRRRRRRCRRPDSRGRWR